MMKSPLKKLCARVNKKTRKKTIKKKMKKKK